MSWQAIQRAVVFASLSSCASDWLSAPEPHTTQLEERSYKPIPSSFLSSPPGKSGWLEESSLTQHDKSMNAVRGFFSALWSRNDPQLALYAVEFMTNLLKTEARSSDSLPGIKLWDDLHLQELANLLKATNVQTRETLQTWTAQHSIKNLSDQNSLATSDYGGFWEYLHTTTILATYLSHASYTGVTPGVVMDHIMWFVDEFLECTSCRHYFRQSYDDCEYLRCAIDREHDWVGMVLWLWRVHEGISLRVAAATSAPRDRRWPPYSECSSCWRSDFSSSPQMNAKSFIDSQKIGNHSSKIDEPFHLHNVFTYIVEVYLSPQASATLDSILVKRGVGVYLSMLAFTTAAPIKTAVITTAQRSTSAAPTTKIEITAASSTTAGLSTTSAPTTKMIVTIAAIPDATTAPTTTAPIVAQPCMTAAPAVLTTTVQPSKKPQLAMTNGDGDSTTTTSASGDGGDNRDGAGDITSTSIMREGDEDVDSTETLSGSLMFKSTVLTKVQVEISSREALAQMFGVDDTDVSVTVIESRRLEGMKNARTLAGNWAVKFEVSVNSSQSAAAVTKASAIKSNTTNFNQAMKAQLKKIGVSDSDAAVQVNSFEAAHSATRSSTVTAVVANSNIDRDVKGNFSRDGETIKEEKTSDGDEKDDNINAVRSENLAIWRNSTELDTKNDSEKESRESKDKEKRSVLGKVEGKNKKEAHFQNSIGDRDKIDSDELGVNNKKTIDADEKRDGAKKGRSKAKTKDHETIDDEKHGANQNKTSQGKSFHQKQHYEDNIENGSIQGNVHPQDKAEGQKDSGSEARHKTVNSDDKLDMTTTRSRTKREHNHGEHERGGNKTHIQVTEKSKEESGADRDVAEDSKTKKQVEKKSKEMETTDSDTNNGNQKPPRLQKKAEGETILNSDVKGDTTIKKKVEQKKKAEENDDVIAGGMGDAETKVQTRTKGGNTKSDTSDEKSGKKTTIPSTKKSKESSRTDRDEKEESQTKEKVKQRTEETETIDGDANNDIHDGGEDDKKTRREKKAEENQNADSGEKASTSASPVEDNGPNEQVAGPWQVIWQGGGVRVRSQPSTEASQIGRKAYGAIVYGFEVHGWLQLEDEPGFMLIQQGAASLLRRVQGNVVPFVSCGNHLAIRCADCGQSAGFCYGECAWSFGSCQRNDIIDRSEIPEAADDLVLVTNESEHREDKKFDSYAKLAVAKKGGLVFDNPMLVVLVAATTTFSLLAYRASYACRVRDGNIRYTYRILYEEEDMPAAVHP